MADRLGIGFIGAGFVTEAFHVPGFQSIRDADVVGVTSRTRESAGRVADKCRPLGVGDPTVHDDVASLVADPAVDAVWVCVPNHVRVETVEAVCDAVRSGRGQLVGIAIEKPLARTYREARQVLDMIEEVGLLHGYLENQCYAPSVTRAKELLWKRGAALSGPPYLARAAEEHAGPHNGWFWDPTQQGGGVLNDMLCHSVEAGRLLLSPPDRPQREYLTPKAVTASIASLKWTRPKYADQLADAYGLDYRRAPAEDYARATFTFDNAEGQEVVVEATTSWSFVGAGLRLSFELLGTEYSASVDTLTPPAKIFLSRNLQGDAGEDLVEKQNAEQGLMPVLADESFSYGYIHEDRHMVEAFRAGRQPDENLHDGLIVVEMLMGAYLSAELGETVKFPITNLEEYVPAVAQGRWDPTRSVAKQRDASSL